MVVAGRGRRAFWAGTARGGLSSPRTAETSVATAHGAQAAAQEEGNEVSKNNSPVHGSLMPGTVLIILHKLPHLLPKTSQRRKASWAPPFTGEEAEAQRGAPVTCPGSR